MKWSGNWKRINHDLHNTLAFYSLIALFIMSATGLFWSFQWYREGWQNAYGVRREQILSKTDTSDTLGPRNFLSAEHLANNIQEAPVWIMAILRNAAESTNPRTGSSIYGAVQHLMLAARAHGIGATLTTLYASHEEDVKKLLGIPEDAMTMALIPLGYPSKGRWAQPKRQPVEDIAFMNHWGQSIS